ncbi:MAG: hypothetical protein FWD91_08435, partial [Treponema sp.]|nr:hypothetical protein [Treponema sp.]
ALLDNVILHFDSEGRFIDYLGREGIGGTPFPRVEGLFATLNDEIAVVTRVPDGWNIYWYDSAGKFIFVVQLDTDAIPVPPERENVFASVDMISAGPNARKLYTKIEYYRNIYDDSTNAILGIEPDSSVIWIMNAETGVWETFVDVPFFEETTVVQNRRIISRKPYSFVGVTKSEQVFLIFPMEGGYSLRIISLSGGGQQRRAFIEIDNGDMQFNAFDLSPDGILTGLLADDWQVKVVWWRTDRFSES